MVNDELIRMIAQANLVAAGYETKIPDPCAGNICKNFRDCRPCPLNRFDARDGNPFHTIKNPGRYSKAQWFDAVELWIEMLILLLPWELRDDPQLYLTVKS